MNAELTQSRVSFVPVILAILLAASVVFGAHAVIRHGQEMVEEIRNNCDQDPLATLRRESDGRIAVICKLGEKHGVQIREADNTTEVTAFPNRGKTLQAVIDYLANVGYK